MIPPPVYSPKANQFVSKRRVIIRKTKNDSVRIGPSGQRQVVRMIPPPPAASERPLGMMLNLYKGDSEYEKLLFFRGV